MGKAVVPEIMRDLSGGANSLPLSDSGYILSSHDLPNTKDLDRPRVNDSSEGVSCCLESQDLQEGETGKKTQIECQSLSWKNLLCLEQVRNPRVFVNQVRKGKESRKGKEQQENCEVISRNELLSLNDYRIDEFTLDLIGGVSANAGEGSNRETQNRGDLDPTKLTLQFRLASGAFGTVYKGLYDGQNVAVKTMIWGDDDKMDPREILTVRNAFTKEAEVWRKLHHRNVTNFIGTVGGRKDLVFVAVMKRWAPYPIRFRANDFCFIVEEYVPGGTLRDYINRSKDTLPSGLPFKIIMKLAIQIAKALCYIHKQNVVHRDVKCLNILVTRELVVKITDFGIARHQASDAGLMTGTLGTLGYIAPEVLNNCPYDHKCDVFSFGIVLWEIFHRNQVNRKVEYLDATTGVRPHISRSCPAPLARLIRKCWDANPHIRPSMFSVLCSLKALKARNLISDLFEDLVSGLNLS